MKKNIKKYSIIKYTVCIILIISFIITGGYSYYGGLGTGKCANVNEFEKYAVTVEDISIPEQARIAIYQTEEMENLISWMREYNKSAGQGNDIRFYGFDMQRREYNYRYTVHYTEFFQEAIVYGHLQQNFMMR